MLSPAPPILLEPNSSGGLLVWEPPVKGKRYVVGSDTAHGLAKGDFAAAVVIEGETCALVARWKERENPHVWGPKCALLSWYYNEALLVIETQPGASGITAWNAARDVGYKNLYIKRRQDAIRHTMSEILGWHTNSTTKPLIIDRIKRALEEDCSIPDMDLLEELHRQRWSEKAEMVGPSKRSHDDLIIAYGMALVIRDQSWIAGKLRPEPFTPTTLEERVWANILKPQPTRGPGGRRVPWRHTWTDRRRAF